MASLDGLRFEIRGVATFAIRELRIAHVSDWYEPRIRVHP
jgi:hypothetical protein